jgi:hypothetical protein
MSQTTVSNNGKGLWEMVKWLVEILLTKGDAGEGVWEMVNWLVEQPAKGKVGE